MTRPAGNDVWCEDLAWFLGESSAALGFHGTTGSVIAMIEAGGPGGFGSDHERITDAQLGWGRCSESSPARWRRLNRVWVIVARAAQVPLLAYYGPVQVPDVLRGELRHWAPVALVTADDPGPLLLACAKLASLPIGKRKSAADQLERVDAAKKAAEHAVRRAHESWYDAEGEQLEAWVG